MRLVIQRVKNAKVDVYSEQHPTVARTLGAIDGGMMVLVGIAPGDDEAKIKAMAKKLVGIRFWDDTQGKPWSLNVVEAGHKILLVSQFTLFAHLKGTKPDFHGAMEPDRAKMLYYSFVEQVRVEYNALAAKIANHPANTVTHLVPPPPGPHTKKNMVTKRFNFGAIEAHFEALITKNPTSVLNQPICDEEGLELYDFNEFVQTTMFGSMMDVSLCNFGPVTIIVESPETPQKKIKESNPPLKTSVEEVTKITISVEALPPQTNESNLSDIVKHIEGSQPE